MSSSQTVEETGETTIDHSDSVTETSSEACRRPSCHSRHDVRLTSIEGATREALLCRTCRKQFQGVTT